MVLLERKTYILRIRFLTLTLFSIFGNGSGIISLSIVGSDLEVMLSSAVTQKDDWLLPVFFYFIFFQMLNFVECNFSVITAITF